MFLKVELNVTKGEKYKALSAFKQYRGRGLVAEVARKCPSWHVFLFGQEVRYPCLCQQTLSPMSAKSVWLKHLGRFGVDLDHKLDMCGSQRCSFHMEIIFCFVQWLKRLKMTRVGSEVSDIYKARCTYCFLARKYKYKTPKEAILASGKSSAITFWVSV